MNQTLVPPPFNNGTPTCVCPSETAIYLHDCKLPVVWQFKQQISVACTAGLVFGVMASIAMYKIIKPYKPMLRLRKISMFKTMDPIPESPPVGALMMPPLQHLQPASQQPDQIVLNV